MVPPEGIAPSIPSGGTDLCRAGARICVVFFCRESLIRSLPHWALDEGPDPRGGPGEGEDVVSLGPMRRQISVTGQTRARGGGGLDFTPDRGSDAVRPSLVLRLELLADRFQGTNAQGHDLSVRHWDTYLFGDPGFREPGSPFVKVTCRLLEALCPGCDGRLHHCDGTLSFAERLPCLQCQRGKKDPVGE